MAAPKKIDEDLMQEREEAWVGDAVLALFMRRLILKEQGKWMVKCSYGAHRTIFSATLATQHLWRP